WCRRGRHHRSFRGPALQRDSPMKLFYQTTLALMMTAVGCFSAAHAGMQLVGTRVIYPANEREVTVHMNNVGDTPRMVQAWIDDGDAKATAETAKAPFILTPPLSRVDPGKGQALRILFTGGNVPQDRESIFWLNVLEISPKPGEDTKNYLQFAVRTRVKILYRPVGLLGDPASSIKQVTWRLVRDKGELSMECSNSTAYNVNLAEVRLKDAAPDTSIGKGGTCPAKGREVFPLKGGSDNGKVVYRAIDDYGAYIDGEAAYSR
ncbi:fimbria/pilus periplasmic chaperone, partial [Lysobacter sp. LF1]